MANFLGSVGENTISSRLTSLLKKHGFNNAEFEMIFHTFKGVRKPDISFQNDKGLCLISAKLGLKKEVEAISSAQEYQQDFSHEFDLGETFSVTYPKKKGKKYHLRVLANKLHSSTAWVLNTLEEVGKKIKEVYEREWKRAIIGAESEITSSIRVLRTGVVNLSSELMHIETDDFEDLFGGKQFFESVLGYHERKREKSKILRSAAAYLFVNQILFYEILSTELPNEYKKIKDSDLDNPESLKPRYFNKVLKKDYRPIFNFDVAGKFNKKSTRLAAKRIILAIRALFPGHVKHDLIGKVFHNIIPLKIRKTVAAYYTNSAAGDLLAKLVIKSPNDIVIDPACGSGTLLVSSYKKKSELLGKNITKTIHKKFVENDLFGIDIMPFSAHLAAVNLALRQPLFETDNVNIAIEDSTTLQPEKTISAVRETLKDIFKTRRLTDFAKFKRNEKIQRGGISLTSEAKDIRLKKVDVVIMNPPFTSCDNLPKEYKKQLKRRFSLIPSHAHCITGKLSFQAYFIFIADKFLKENGRIACVLPMTTFTAKSFSNLTDFLVEKYEIECIVFGIGRSAFSENTSLSEILLIARKRKPIKNNEFVLVGTKKSPSEWKDTDINDIIEQIKRQKSKKEILESEICVTRRYRQEELKQDKSGLTSLILTTDKDFENILNKINSIFKRSKKVYTFKDMEKNLNCKLFAWLLANKGGQYYGYSSLSIISPTSKSHKKSDIIIFENIKNRNIIVKNKLTKEIFKIPLDHIAKQTRRISGLRNIDSSHNNEFVIDSYFSGLERIMNSVYDKEISKIFVKRIRKEWKDKVRNGISNIWISRRMNLSAPGTCILSTFSEEPTFISANAWGIRGITKRDAKIITLWTNSSFYLIEMLTKRGSTEGAYGNIEQRYLYQIHCISPDKLKPKEILKIENTFNEVAKQNLPSLLIQLKEKNPIRKKIDKAFLRVFGISEKESEKILDKLYNVLYEKIRSMKETMSQN